MTSGLACPTSCACRVRPVLWVVGASSAVRGGGVLASDLVWVMWVGMVED